MRRGTKPAKAKVKAKPPVARRSRKSESSRAHDLEKRLAEALEQQTATSEILRVISSSPADIQPVLDTVAESAARLCTAPDVSIFLREAEHLRIAARHGSIPSDTALRLNRESGVGWAVLTGRTVHVADMQDDPDRFPVSFENAQRLGFRTVLNVPLMRKGVAIGAISLRRTEARPFTDKQIALLKTFADQAVIAIENVRLFNELEGRNRDLTESLERETATAEILRVISSSPTDIQPVLAAILDSGRRLCDAEFGAIFRFEDGVFVHAVSTTVTSEFGAWLQTTPIQPGPGTPLRRLGMERRPVQVADILSDLDFAPPDEYRREGMRTALAVPMLKDGALLGALTFHRRIVKPFTDQQIALLETFADQAVIAIENVRLFNETKETLEQQTATAEILRVISSSPTDLQPVLVTVAENAARVCGAIDAQIYRVEGEFLHWVASHGPIPPNTEERLISRGWVTGRAVVDRRTIHVHDLAAESDTEYPVGKAAQRQTGHRTTLSTPLLREGVPLGVISIRRMEVRPFSEKQVRLLKTFADQAVIAIENVRLFKELEARNRDLTATSEVLQVISRSQTDVQPVFDTIVRSAVRLCDGLFSGLYQFDGELLHYVAHHNFTPEALEEVHRVFPARPTRTLFVGRAILERAVVHIPDFEADPEYEHQALSRAVGQRSGLWVPMLREGTPIGVIGVSRAKPGPFSDNEVELLKTFADQAVIAIENVRLFKQLEARTGELTQSVEKLTALGEVSHALSSTLDLDTVLTTIVNRAVQLSGADGGSILEYDEVAEEFQPRASNEVGDVVAATRHTRLRKGEGAVGRMAVTRETVQIPDIAIEGAYDSHARGALLRSGRHALLAVPLLSEEHIVGGLVISRNAAGAFPPEVVELLQTFATQSALAIQNARLFHEIADKSRQLETASQHKSEFLANMSHELRTPLNAVIGFSEVLLQRMFGELNAKQDEYLKDIYASGQHLLSLINDILDLSKIEAGRMELAPAPFHLPTALENAVTLVRERAARHGIALHLDLDPRLGELVGDERKVKQVLLNLLSNAVKFTPEGGRINLKASRIDGAVEIAVTDTGIGIASEDQAAIFEEFRQVGSDETRKQEGTGLGLTLARKFVELHGGRIWVESEPGRGSTFTFTLPVS